MSDSYTLAALRGLGMDGDDSYTSAALRGFGDESYTDAALLGCGCDCGGSYTDAALRGMGKLKKGSPEAKAYMARLRAMRASKSKAGKKLKGGVAFSTIAAALGLIPAAIKGIKGIHAIYKWIKGNGKIKGGRNVYLNPVARNEYIAREINGKFTGLAKARKMPYRIGSLASKVYNSRLKRVPKAVRDYLSYNPEALDDIIADAGKMRDKIRGIQSTLDTNKPQHKVFSSRKGNNSSTSRRRRKDSDNPPPRTALGFPTGNMIVED